MILPSEPGVGVGKFVSWGFGAARTADWKGKTVAISAVRVKPTRTRIQEVFFMSLIILHV
jgi:hypothetical protein